MKRGKFVEGLLVLVAAVFLVVSIIIYQRKDETEGSKALDVATTTQGSINTVKAEQKKIEDEQKTFAETTVTMLADLNKRLDEVEKKPAPTQVASVPQNINLHLKEPVTFNVMYHDKPKALPEVIPPQISGKKSKTPLSDKAGLHPRENN